jgi:LAS superfamily LD-carboxypeptidase LdcB
VAGKKRRAPVGVDTGVGSSIWEPQEPVGRYALGLGIEHSSESGMLHLTDKLHLESQSNQSLSDRTGFFHSEHPDAVLWDYLGYESFRDAVMARHILNSSHDGTIDPASDIPLGELTVVKKSLKKGDQELKLRKEAATALFSLLDAARKAAGADDTIEIGSAYRSPSEDRRLWLSYFRKYYWETLHKRRQFLSGPLGGEAVAFMAHYVGKWKAAPGYSNHSKGIAVDFHYRHGKTWLKCAHADSSLAAWKKTPFYQWLAGPTGDDGHAKDFKFHPYHPEPWHWEYKP